jgi:hypothetical protein
MMGKIYPEIDEKLSEWINKQHLVFVATAPTGSSGHVNLSPKGGPGTFRIIGPHSVGYLDLIGSGIETVAHLRENHRITLMFCAFEGPPRIVRLYGHGTVLQKGDSGFEEFISSFDPSSELLRSLRSGIHIEVDRISDSCGFMVPHMDFVEERSALFDYTRKHFSDDGTGKAAFLTANNLQSIDGLLGVDPPDNVEANLVPKLSSRGKAL